MGSRKSIIAKFKDEKTGQEHEVTATDATRINKVMNPPPEYHCKHCGIPLVLASKKGNPYFRAKGERLEKRSEEEKSFNGHKEGCEYRARVKRKTVTDDSYSRDLSGVCLEDVLRKGDLIFEKKEAPTSGAVMSGQTSTKVVDNYEWEEGDSSKPRLIRTARDIYYVSYITEFSRREIRLSTKSGKKAQIRECVLNAKTFLSFRNGTYSLEGYKQAVAMKIGAQDQIGNAIRTKVKELGMAEFAWVLCDPYAGNRLSRVYYALVPENNKADKRLRDTLMKRKGPGYVYLIGCEWERLSDGGSDLLTINVNGKKMTVCCYLGHIRGDNIEELPVPGTAERREDPELLDFDFTKEDL